MNANIYISLQVKKRGKWIIHCERIIGDEETKLCVNYSFITFLRSNPPLGIYRFPEQAKHIVLYGKWYMKSPRQTNKLFDIFLAGWLILLILILSAFSKTSVLSTYPLQTKNFHQNHTFIHTEFYVKDNKQKHYPF